MASKVLRQQQRAQLLSSSSVTVNICVNFNLHTQDLTKKLNLPRAAMRQQQICPSSPWLHHTSRLDDIPCSMTGRLLALLGLISWHITGFYLPARWCIGSECTRHEGALHGIANFKCSE